MDSLGIVQDSLRLKGDVVDSVIRSCTEVCCMHNDGWWDDFAWFLPFLFSVVTYYIGFRTSKKNEAKNERVVEADRRMSLFKALILDYNLKYVYEFFDGLENVLSELKDKKCDKKKLEQQIQNKFKLLNERFVYLLLAVDKTFYDKVLNLSDNFRDTLMCNISDKGVNLYVEQKYSELINIPYKDFKTNLLKFLFDYRGS